MAATIEQVKAGIWTVEEWGEWFQKMKDHWASVEPDEWVTYIKYTSTALRLKPAFVRFACGGRGFDPQPVQFVDLDFFSFPIAHI